MHPFEQKVSLSSEKARSSGLSALFKKGDPLSFSTNEIINI